LVTPHVTRMNIGQRVPPAILNPRPVWRVKNSSSLISGAFAATEILPTLTLSGARLQPEEMQGHPHCRGNAVLSGIWYLATGS